ncbi:MAG: hypothetical protein OSB70_02915 [Myxococcota bacterium]|nr:hypothetical protein [Myxococcota bacterium]
MTSLSHSSSARLHRSSVRPTALAADVAERRDLPQIAPPVDAPAHAIDCTFIEVLEAIADVADSDEEVLATLAHMLESGRIKLSQVPGPHPTQSHVYC